MNDRNQRLLIFIGSLVAALLVILVVMLLTSDDGEPSADGAVSTTAIESTTTEPSGTTEPPPTTEAAPDPTVSPDTTEVVEAPPPAEEPPPTEAPPPAGPVEVFRGIADVTDPGLFGTGTIPLFAVSVAGDEFATSHPWSLVSVAEPTMDACNAGASGGFVANPVRLTILGISNGWYGCSRMEDDHLARLHLIDVQPANQRVIAEIVVWDLTP